LKRIKANAKAAREKAKRDGDPPPIVYMSALGVDDLQAAGSLVSAVKVMIDEARAPVYAEPLMQYAPYPTAAENRIYRQAVGIAGHGYVSSGSSGDPKQQAQLDAIDMINALEAIPAAERGALVLAARGHTQKEIAARLKVTDRTVRNLLTAAKAKMREYLSLVPLFEQKGGCSK